MESMVHMFYMQGTAGVHPAFEEETFGCSSCRCIPVSKFVWLCGKSAKFLAQIELETEAEYWVNLPTKFCCEKQLYPEYNSQQIDFTPTK